MTITTEEDKNKTENMKKITTKPSCSLVLFRLCEYAAILAVWLEYGPPPTGVKEKEGLKLKRYELVVLLPVNVSCLSLLRKSVSSENVMIGGPVP